MRERCHLKQDKLSQLCSEQVRPGVGVQSMTALCLVFRSRFRNALILLLPVICNQSDPQGLTCRSMSWYSFSVLPWFIRWLIGCLRIVWLACSWRQSRNCPLFKTCWLLALNYGRCFHYKHLCGSFKAVFRISSGKFGVTSCIGRPLLSRL